MTQAERPANMYLTAVILAGGDGTRIGSDTPKQFRTICGMPIILRTLLAFDCAKTVRDIVLVIREGDIARYTAIGLPQNVRKPLTMIPGGRTRQDSAQCGLAALPTASTHLAIHDGARCLITPEQIDAVAQQALCYGAAAAASHAKDTVKLADAQGFISGTTDRARTWLAGTPQIFECSSYREACSAAARDGLTATDDCALLEHIGVRVKLCDSGYENIKITTPEDLLFAEEIIRKRGLSE